MSTKQRKRSSKPPNWSWTLVVGTFLVAVIPVVWFLIEPGFEPLVTTIPNLLAILIYFGLRKSDHQKKLDQAIAVIMLIITFLVIIVLVDVNKPTESPITVSVQCEVQIIHGFGKVWYENPELSHNLGCPPSATDYEKAVTTTFQRFETGMMIALHFEQPDEPSKVYVLFSDGSFQSFSNFFNLPTPESQYTAQGFYYVGSSFSGAYWRGTNVDVRGRLGFATSLETVTQGTYQIFTNGIMLWLQNLDEIYAFVRLETDKTQSQFQWFKFEDDFDVFVVPYP